MQFRRVPAEGERAALRPCALPRRDDRCAARARAGGGRPDERHARSALRARARARLGRLRPRRAAPALAGRGRGRGRLPGRGRRDHRAWTPTTATRAARACCSAPRRSRTPRSRSTAPRTTPSARPPRTCCWPDRRPSPRTCAAQLGLSTSVDDLLDKVEVEAEQNANVLRITATRRGPAPGGAAGQRLRQRVRRLPRPRRPPEHRGRRAATSRSSWHELPLDAPERQDLRDVAPAAGVAARAGQRRRARDRAAPRSPTNPSNLGLAQVLALAGIIGLALGLVGRAGGRVDGQAHRRRGQLRARVPAARAGGCAAEGLPATGAAGRLRRPRAVPDPAHGRGLRARDAPGAHGDGHERGARRGQDAAWRSGWRRRSRSAAGR